MIWRILSLSFLVGHTRTSLEGNIFEEQVAITSLFCATLRYSYESLG